MRAYDGDVDRYRAECWPSGAPTQCAARKSKGNGATKPTPQRHAAAAEMRAALAPLKRTWSNRGRDRAPVAADRHHRRRPGRQRALHAHPERAQALSRERGGLARAREEAEAAGSPASEAYERATTGGKADPAVCGT